MVNSISSTTGPSGIISQNLSKFVSEAKEFILKKIQEAGLSGFSNSKKKKVSIVLGSGLGEFSKSVNHAINIPYQFIPHFRSSTVAGHSGELIIGEIGDSFVFALSGRTHLYEGLSPLEITFPLYVLKELGVETIILSNAAGGINLNYKKGDLVLIEDHLNMTGTNPLVGQFYEGFGPRFSDMTYCYTPALKEKISSLAEKMKINLKKGVYVGVLGPCYETPSEIKMYRTMGADLVGMSTVCEAIVARFLGMQILGLSIVTNMASGILSEELKHDDIKLVAQSVGKNFVPLLVNFLREV